MESIEPVGAWLILAHQFPPGPNALRVRVWRRLQGLGAVAIKNALYVLPHNEETREDFAWILRELRAGGGDGLIIEARLVDGMDDAQLRRLFDEARSTDYRALADDIRDCLESLRSDAAQSDERVVEAGGQLTRFRRKLAEIEAVDFFGADGREAVEALVDRLGARLAGPRQPRVEAAQVNAISRNDFKGKVWVTRRDVHVDRIASAWLIRGWLDREAVFKFTDDKSYRPGPREVRFDMFEAEFTHEGDLCTFEVLLQRFGLHDPALQRIGQIVHDIDLKDGKYGCEETVGIAHLLAGLIAGIDDDDQRIVRGSASLDDLYQYFCRQSAQTDG